MSEMVPGEILGMIEAEIAKEKDALEKAKEEEEAKDARLLARGRELYQDYVDGVLPEVPEVMRPFLDESAVDDGVYRSIGLGYKPESVGLMFSVPGLAPMRLNTKPEQWVWIVAQIDSGVRSNSAPEYDLKHYGKNFDDLDPALVYAFNMATQFAKQTEEHRKYLDDERRRQEEYQAREEQEVNEATTGQEREESEAQALLDALKGDPVAILMLKAYLVIRAERSEFARRVNDMDEAMDCLQDASGRRVDILQRQAKEAKSQAEEERRRADDLQDDLDQAKKAIGRNGR